MLTFHSSSVTVRVEVDPELIPGTLSKMQDQYGFEKYEENGGSPHRPYNEIYS